ncbi:MAG: hypothetical protein V1792_05510, partial [Pseudomonadota bacterium]
MYALAGKGSMAAQAATTMTICARVTTDRKPHLYSGARRDHPDKFTKRMFQTYIGDSNILEAEDCVKGF